MLQHAPAVLSLALLAHGCLLYDTRVCDDPNPNACDAGIVAPPQRLRDFRQEDRNARPMVGSAVGLRSQVVTAVDGYIEGSNGEAGDMWIQERVTDPNFRGCAPHPQGGRVCGIQLFSPTVIPAGTRALPGDLVHVNGGRYDEFDCTPCCAAPRPPCLFSDGRTLPELSEANVERVGSSRIPDPIPVTLAEVVAGGDAYMGVLVRITDTITLGATDMRGEIDIGMGVKLTNQLAPLVNPMTQQPLAMGTRVRLTGIVSYFFGSKLLPRSTADIEIVP